MVFLLVLLTLVSISILAVLGMRRVAWIKPAAVAVAFVACGALIVLTGNKSTEESSAPAEEADTPSELTNPARRYRRRVARQIEAEFPEAELATCTPTVDETLRCLIRISSTPNVPEGGSMTLDVVVNQNGSYRLPR